ncbi:MAG: hypothetical protein ACQGVK_03585 [Myxococcota bacterium]
MGGDENRAGGGADAGGGRLGSIFQRGGKLVAGFTDTVKEATRTGLLKQALDARDRGNLAAAFHLLEEEYGERGDEVDVAVAFWDVASEYDRAPSAAPAVAGLIRRYAQAGQVDLATQYWVELTTRVEGALAEPAALVRIVPALQEQVEAAQREAAGAEEEDAEAAVAKDERAAALVQALRAAVHPDNSGLTPGIAIHVAEQARELDPDSALTAARSALENFELHEAKRRRMLELIAELDPEAEPPPPLEELEEPPPPVPEPVDAEEAPPETPTPSGSETAPRRPGASQHPLYTESPPRPELSDDELEALRRRLPPTRSAQVPSDDQAEADPQSASSGRRLEVHNGRLSSLGEATLVVELEGSRRARVSYEALEAVAVAQVDGLAPETRVVVDLLLNWRSGPSHGQPLRGVRLRLSGLDEAIELDEPDGAHMSGRELLAELLDRAPAAPLPGPDAALGGPIPHFASAADYAREVLGIVCS